MKLFYLIILAFLFLVTGCSQKTLVQTPPPVIQPDDTPKRMGILQNALKHHGKKDGGDCSGFVTLVNKESFAPYFTTEELNEYFEDSRRSLAIYNLLETQNRLYHEKPKVGDLVFFANTVKEYAKAKKSVDNITHIGIITKIDNDETVHFIHHTKGKNLISQMNLNYPTDVNYEEKKNQFLHGKIALKIEGYLCLAPAYFSAYGSIK